MALGEDHEGTYGEQSQDRQHVLRGGTPSVHEPKSVPVGEVEREDIQEHMAAHGEKRRGVRNLLVRRIACLCEALEERAGKGKAERQTRDRAQGVDEAEEVDRAERHDEPREKDSQAVAQGNGQAGIRKAQVGARHNPQRAYPSLSDAF